VNFPDFPAPAAVPLAAALCWPASPDWLYETKADGKRALLGNGELRGRAMRYRLPGEVPAALAGCTFDGELVASTYYVFDLLETEGQDLRALPLRERKRHLAALECFFPDWLKPIPTARPGEPGGEYLAAVLRAGGEGICAKRLGAPYGFGWHKAKRRETFDAIVASKSLGKLSVSLAQYDNGALVDCGRVAVLCQSTFAELHPGSVLELSAQGRTARGKFREPVFIRTREDKPATACTVYA
jgi:ATP-dependent DNA ligase